MSEVEHKLVDMAYGVGRMPVPQGDGSVKTLVILKFTTHDQKESWIFPMDEKVAEDIASKMSGKPQVVQASFADLAKLSQ